MLSGKTYTPKLRSGRLYLLQVGPMIVFGLVVIFGLGIPLGTTGLIFLGSAILFFSLLSTGATFGTLQCKITPEGLIASSALNQTIRWDEQSQVSSMMGMIMVTAGSRSLLDKRSCILPATWLVKDLDSYKAAIATYAPENHPLRRHFGI